MPEVIQLFSSIQSMIIRLRPCRKSISGPSGIITTGFCGANSTCCSIALYPRGQIFKPLKGLEIVRAGTEYGRARGVEAIIYAEKPYAGLRRFPSGIQRDCPKVAGRTAIMTHGRGAGAWMK